MVELRKRPQRDPPAPAPASKRSKAKATNTTTPTATESKGESSTAASTGVVGKAKRAASKVKEAIAGPLETGGDTATTESAAKQPSVLDEPVGADAAAAVETGETGMIPETAGTAPSSTTVPGETGVAGGEGTSAETATVPGAGAGAGATVVEGKKGRGKGKNVGAAAPVSAPVVPVTEAPAAEATTGTGTGDSATATLLPNSTTTEGKAIRSKAKNIGLGGSSTAATTAAAGPPPAAPATTEPTGTEESRPPTTEDLENPPEKGKIDTSTTTSAAATATLEPATLPLSPTSVGKAIPDLSAFGGPLTLHTDTTTTFAELLSQSTSGLIIFTYPRASTPGCTQQACSFRDNHDIFTKDSGYAVYGLSTDSVKANSGFATKQGLQYPLVCDGGAVLTGALGMKKGGAAKGTLRGVVVVDREGVVRVWFQGGPAKTVDAVKEFLSAKG